MTLCRQRGCNKPIHRRKLCRQHYFYERTRRELEGEVVSRKVDPGRAHDHLQELVRLGHSARTLSYLSGGVNRNVIGRILRQDGPISSQSELAVLRIPVYQDKPWRDLDDRYMFPVTGTKRRMQALLAMGWTQLEIARRAGIPQQAVTCIVRGTRERCLVQVVRGVAEAYERMENERPPKSPTKRVLTYHWPVPAEWDPETIDDPDETHDVESRKRGRQKVPMPHIAETNWSTARRMHSHLARGTGRPRVSARDHARVCAHLLRKGHDVADVATAFRKSRQWVYAKAREGGWTPASTPGGESGKLQEAS